MVHVDRHGAPFHSFVHIPKNRQKCEVKNIYKYSIWCIYYLTYICFVMFCLIKAFSYKEIWRILIGSILYIENFRRCLDQTWPR
jgi:hypothetical protein